MYIESEDWRVSSDLQIAGSETSSDFKTTLAVDDAKKEDENQEIKVNMMKKID